MNCSLKNINVEFLDEIWHSCFFAIGMREVFLKKAGQLYLDGSFKEELLSWLREKPSGLVMVEGCSPKRPHYKSRVCVLDYCRANNRHQCPVFKDFVLSR